MGTAPAGLWHEEVTEVTSTQSGVRYIDPVTRDYAYAGGEILRGSAARQRIVLLLTTEFKTSMAIKGIRFPATHDARTARVVSADVKRTLQPMIDDGSILLTEVSATTRADGVVGRLGVHVAYVDLETGESGELDL